jgi:hypothetical protein
MVVYAQDRGNERTDAMEKATIRPNTLSDGSKTYTVLLRDTNNGRVVAFIEAVDETHAIELCRVIDRSVGLTENY